MCVSIFHDVFGTYAKTLLVVCLKFRLNWTSSILSGNPAPKLIQVHFPPNWGCPIWISGHHKPMRVEGRGMLLSSPSVALSLLQGWRESVLNGSYLEKPNLIAGHVETIEGESLASRTDMPWIDLLTSVAVSPPPQLTAMVSITRDLRWWWQGLKIVSCNLNISFS